MQYCCISLLFTHFCITYTYRAFILVQFIDIFLILKMDWWLQLTSEAIRTVLTPSLSRKTVDSFDMRHVFWVFEEATCHIMSSGRQLWPSGAQHEPGCILEPRTCVFCWIFVTIWIQNLMMDEALKYCLKLADTDQNGTLDFEAKFSEDLLIVDIFSSHLVFKTHVESLVINWTQWNRETSASTVSVSKIGLRSSSISYANFGIRNLRWTVQSWH